MVHVEQKVTKSFRPGKGRRHQKKVKKILSRTASDKWFFDIPHYIGVRVQRRKKIALLSDFPFSRVPELIENYLRRSKQE